MGTQAAQGAAGQAAMQAAKTTTGGQIGSALGTVMGQSANQGAFGDLSQLMGGDPSQGSLMNSVQGATTGGQQDGYSPTPQSWEPSKTPMRRSKPASTPIAFKLMQNLPSTTY